MGKNYLCSNEGTALRFPIGGTVYGCPWTDNGLNCP